MVPAYSGLALQLSRSFGFSPGFDWRIFFIPNFASAKRDYTHEPHRTSTFTLEQIKTEKNTPFQEHLFISSIIFIWVNKIPGLCCWCFQHILNVLEMFSTHASDWGNVQSFTILMCFFNIFHVSVWRVAPSACWFFLHRRGSFDSY